MDSKELETRRKYNEYKMKLIKMSGSLSDFYIDRAIETGDYSEIQGLLIDYFFDHVPARLMLEYEENELDKKIEDMDIDLGEWQRLKSTMFDKPVSKTWSEGYHMNTDQYTEAMIEKRKNTPTDDNT